MTPLGIHHVNLTVADAEEARAFYCEVLGMKVRDDRPDFPFAGWWLDIGHEQLHLVVGEPTKEKGGDHFAIRVGDLDATIVELREKGIRITDPMGVGANRQSFLRDPWGNRIELQQVAAASAP